MTTQYDCCISEHFVLKKDSLIKCVQSGIHDDSFASTILFKHRSNNFNLNQKKIWKDKEIKCELYEEEKEDLKHYLLWCLAYSKERKKYFTLQWSYQEEKKYQEFLFDMRLEEGKEIIYRF